MGVICALVEWVGYCILISSTPTHTHTHARTHTHTHAHPHPRTHTHTHARTHTQRRGGTIDVHTDRRGLLWILDEESVFPGATDGSFLDRLQMYHGDPTTLGDAPLVKVIKEDNQFSIFHCQRTLSVFYDANGWVKRAREHPSFRVVVQVMAESKR